MILDESRVLILTENLYKSYKLGNEMKEAVSDLNIRIMQGEFIIIQGLCGIQKNIFFNLIGCLERPTAGKYYFDYEDIALAKEDMLDNIRRNKIGFLFKDFNLINRLTAVKNIEIPMYGLSVSQKEKKDRVVNSLRSFGIETIAEEKVSALSGLNKQLVSLARAIVNNPLMIIADEPAANMDSIGKRRIMEHLFGINAEGTTIMLFTEDEIIDPMCGYRIISLPFNSKEEA
ncbi:MAG: ATP-binding cassette domain-containing protein [Clostridiaceae bacterium]|nr:ATP-binding cassette domain-containing protein [Clostridiaceae bacterium]